ncbi:MAG: hypothetical protein GJ676_15140 [Rhodobacteraceae bacterium]|nr:hypothetical protein [Paracoccaceae bacterium]
MVLVSRPYAMLAVFSVLLCCLAVGLREARADEIIGSDGQGPVLGLPAGQTADFGLLMLRDGARGGSELGLFERGSVAIGAILKKRPLSAYLTLAPSDDGERLPDWTEDNLGIGVSYGDPDRFMLRGEISNPDSDAGLTSDSDRRTFSVRAFFRF